MSGDQQIVEHTFPTIPGKSLSGDDEPVVIQDEPTLTLDPDAADVVLLDQILTYYQHTLAQVAVAQRYFERLGVTMEIAQRYRLGYSNRTLGLHLPSKQLKAGRLIRSRLTDIGIYRATGHEHFTGSLVIPFFDAAGGIVQVHGFKLLGHELRAGTPLEVWLNRPIPPLWNERSLLRGAGVILCSSIQDALAAIAGGHERTCAVTSANAAEVVGMFQQHGVSDVRMAYPSTSEENAQATALEDALTQAGIRCSRVTIPPRLTVAQWAKRVKATGQSMDLDHAATTGITGAPPATTIDVPAPAVAPHPQSVPAPMLPAPVPRVVGDDVFVTLGDREYRVRGLGKNSDSDALRVNVRVLCGDLCHVDTLDLYNARNRVGFQNAAGDEIGCLPDVIKRDLGRLILACEQAQMDRAKALEKPEDSTPVMSPEEEAEALSLLRDEKLTQRIIDAFDQCGVVGEQLNKLTGYLAAVSRKLSDPLAIVIQSSSAAGKTSLMDAILSFVPP